MSNPPCTSIVPIGNQLALDQQWLGGDTSIAGTLCPTSRDDVVDVVRWAQADKQNISVRGLGTSGCEIANPDQERWILDISGVDALTEEFSDSKAFWLPAHMSIATTEEFLLQRNLSLGIWASLYSQRSLAGTLSVDLPIWQRRFYQQGPSIIAIEGVTPNGQRVVTAEAPRVATGMGVKELWTGARGTMGPITRVLVTSDRRSDGPRDYCIELESFEEGNAIVKQLLRQEHQPELAIMANIKNNYYLFWSHRVRTTRDILLNDWMLQLGEGRFRDNVASQILEQFQLLTQLPASQQFQKRVRISEIEQWAPKATGRAKSIPMFELVGSRGWIYRARRPVHRGLEQGNAKAIVGEMRASFDSSGVFA